MLNLNPRITYHPSLAQARDKVRRATEIAAKKKRQFTLVRLNGFGYYQAITNWG